MKTSSDFSRQLKALASLLDELEAAQEKERRLKARVDNQTPAPQMMTPPKRTDDLTIEAEKLQTSVQREHQLRSYLQGKLSEESEREQKVLSHVELANSALDSELAALQSRHAMLQNKLASLRETIQTTQLANSPPKAKSAARSQPYFPSRAASSASLATSIQFKQKMLKKLEQEIETMRDKKVILENKNRGLKRRAETIVQDFAELERVYQENKRLEATVLTLMGGLGIPSPYPGVVDTRGREAADEVERIGKGLISAGAPVKMRSLE